MPHSKNDYKIRLYRSWRFYLVCAVLFALAGFHLVYNFYLLTDGGLSVLLFAKARSGDAAALPSDITRVAVWISFVLIQIELLYELVYTTLGLFGNRLYVREDDTRIYFAPRLISRVYKRDICKIEPASVEDVSFWDRLSSLNFDKKHLYRFTFYDMELLISSKDEAGMEKLTADIAARCNRTEEEETGTDGSLGGAVQLLWRWDVNLSCWLAVHIGSFLLLIFA